MSRAPLSPDYDGVPEIPADLSLLPPAGSPEAKALRAFWRGMFCGVILTLVLGSIAAVLT
jgi:hypothetical protein